MSADLAYVLHLPYVNGTTLAMVAKAVTPEQIREAEAIVFRVWSAEQIIAAKAVVVAEINAELLAALKLALPAMEFAREIHALPDEFLPAIKAARAAIAKATDKE